MKLSRILWLWLWLCLCLCTLLLIWYLFPRNTASLPPGFHREIILANDARNPIHLAELPGGHILVAEKGGRLLRFDPLRQPVSASIFLKIDDIDAEEERGIHAIALDPDYDDNGHIYIYYSHKSSGRNRIARFTQQGNTAPVTSEFLVWQSPLRWRKDCCHYGGALTFGPDGNLYLATGDEFDSAQAQDLTRAGGKILRIGKDGSIPADNPFIDGPNGNLDEIWSYGLRNPFRAYWDIEADRFYIGEVGGNVQATAREDLHIGRRGANYGWPYCEGSCGVPAWDDAFYSYPHVAETPAGGAIVAGFIYRGEQFPAIFRGALFFADYAGGWIRYLLLNEDGSVASVNDFARDTGAPVYLMQSRDGALWYADFNGQIGRITYSDSESKPKIEDTSATPDSGHPPLTVQFSGTASGQLDDNTTYRWLFGDGTEADGLVAEHTYERRGSYIAHLRVSNGSQTTLSAPLQIRVGDPPTITIEEPVADSLFQAGDSIRFSGRAVAQGQPLPDAAYRWRIDFTHNEHTHPVLSEHTGKHGVLNINQSGHDYHDNTGYRIQLQVTDQDGLIGSSSVTIRPQKANLVLTTTPDRIPIMLDGVQLATPINYDTMVGFRHVVSTSTTHCVGATAYRFSHWSDGNDQTHQITVPADTLSLQAHFTVSGGCNDLPTDSLVVRIESDIGVETHGDSVVAWKDQLKPGLTLTAIGKPILQPGAIGDLPAIRLDGVDDQLTSVALEHLPTGSADREIYTVVRYLGVGYGGISYGRTADNQVFGLLVTPGGKLMTQGWGYLNDFPTDTNGNGTGWIIDAATIENNNLSHFLDGVLIGRTAHIFNTASDLFVIGAELDSSSHVEMQIAAVLIYNRALQVSERDAVYRYLNNKYFTYRAARKTITDEDENAAQLGYATRLAAALDKYRRWQAHYASRPFIEQQRCSIQQILKIAPCAESPTDKPEPVSD